MTEAVRSVLSAEHAPIRDLLGDALGVLAISAGMTGLLWLPAILSA
ncbi:MAG: hypothetical protein Q4G26_03965 [Paracoccus sp. (in: a-proteobacteria)]|nr:hypothetical protein [Paracoccus sp. (in: a-proteobacteria)]